MPKPPRSSSELELGFNEAPPGSTSQTPLSISDLTSGIRHLLETSLGEVWVAGEISNYRSPGSGHLYFTLKDAGATLAAVMFRGEAMRTRLRLQDGQAVLARGRITVYEARGQYQMQVLELRAQGQGALQQRFEELKRRLQAEGLFDLARKRPLPVFPVMIGIVTSLRGAVLQDLRQVLQRRAPGMHLQVRGVRVQGEGAAAEIAAAVRAFGAESKVDLIIVARGGGSLEDLWAFNEEVVARALAESPLPTVSAVGHETDFSMADFVADLRAPTPSAAAEMITRDWAEWREEVDRLRARLHRTTRHQLSQLRRELARLAESYVLREPRRLVQQWAQHLDDSTERLHQNLRNRLARLGHTLELLESRLKTQHPARQLLSRRNQLLSLQTRLLAQHPGRKIKVWRDRLELMAARLRSLGPQGTLDRGYALMLDEAGHPIRRAEPAHENQVRRLIVSQGTFRVTVNSAQPDETLWESLQAQPTGNTAPRLQKTKKKL